MQLLAIPSHVYVCATQDGCVFLDLKRDQYYGLDKDAAAQLDAVVSGWPALISMPYLRQIVTPEMLAAEPFKSLLDLSLLIQNPGAENPVRCMHRIDMTAALISVGDELEVRGEIKFHHAASFLSAYVSARYWLAWRGLFSIVTAVQKKKSCESGNQQVCDIFRLAKMVDIFRRLRPYVFGAEGRCLLHALTLVKFLGRYGIYPEWVIGVCTKPWSAHSWVQSGNFLLDTNPEKVCQFTPIMVV
jgi:Transglutaminase-like superfamily